MKPIHPTDLPALRARLAVDRPLHWGLARSMLAALEAAWRELGRLPADGPLQRPDTPTVEAINVVLERNTDAASLELDEQPAPKSVPKRDQDPAVGPTQAGDLRR